MSVNARPDFPQSIDWQALSTRLRSGTSPLEIQKDLASTGVLRLDLPPKMTKSPTRLTEVVDVFEAAGSVNLDLRDVVGLGHARPLGFANGPRHEPLLQECAEGKSFWAICITEREAGSDLAAMKSTAVPSATGYVLNGVKRYVSRLQEASHYLVFAKVPRGGEERLSVFIVPRDARGLAIHQLSPSGLAGTSWGELQMQDVAVPAHARVGGEGQGFMLFHQHFAYWRTMMAAAALGAGRTVMRMAERELKSRSAFGAPIGRFTHLQQEFAKHSAQLHMAGLLVRNAARKVEKNIEPSRYAAMAKAEVVEIAHNAVQWALMAFGARGVDKETGLSRVQLDLGALRIADGTTDVLRTQVARSVLGEDLFRMALGRSKSR